MTNAAANAGSGPGGAYAGNDFRAAYAPGVALSGSGQTLALVEFDGYHTDDITYYEKLAGLPKTPLKNVLLNGFSGVGSGSGGELEVALDIEVAIAMAPGLSSLIVYEAGPTGSWQSMLNRIATDNLAKQISCSWYMPGAPADPVADQIFKQMAAQGQSFFVASGDLDAYTALIPFPCDTPFVTLVGGSTLTTTGPGGAWVAETVWNWGPTSWGALGAGGGISTQYSIPYWQQGLEMTANQGSTTMRNVPDVALVADNVYVRSAGSDFNVGGTSCAAPLWAAFTALVNEQARTSGGPVGFLNPALYALSQGTAYPAGFRDTITGNNFSPQSPEKFTAVPGYDLCTGLGTPAGQALIESLAGLPDSLQVSPSSFAAIGAAGGPFLPNTVTYTLTNGGINPVEWNAHSTQAWISLSEPGGVLAVGGTAEVIASINENANGLALAEYSGAIVFGNASSGLVQTRPVNLSVRRMPPAITGSFSATGVLGTSFSYQITAANEPVSYDARGLPADLRVDKATGLISGSPAVSGTFPVILLATNALGSGTGHLLLTINAAPSVRSDQAAGISTTVATLRGEVNPNGFATTIHFEYGVDPTLAAAYLTSDTTVGDGRTSVSLLEAIRGLSPTTKYYFRVIASNIGGTRAGSILSFITASTPLIPIITPNPVQSVSDSGAALGAFVNPKGAATTVTFEYGLTAAYGSSTAPLEIGSGSAPVYAGADLSGLAPGTLYHYRAVTVSALGTFYGPDQTFITQAESGLFAVASINDTAPGIPYARFRGLGNPTLNDQGHSAFCANVGTIPGAPGLINSGNNSGIWHSETGLLVRTGDDAPGIPNGRFATLSDPVFNNNEAIAFRGTVKTGAPGITGANAAGIWATDANRVLRMVARARTQAPGCPAGAVFASFSKIALPDQGGVVILGNLAGAVVGSNNQGIWAVDSAGELKLIIRKGDTQKINGVAKVVSGLSLFAPSRFAGNPGSYNSPGDLIFKVRFTDGTETIEKAIFP